MMTRYWEKIGLVRVESMNMTSKDRLRHAFTLIELLVVVAIIGLLITLLTPALGRAQEMARQMGCVNNLRQVGVAIFLYEGDHEELPSPRSGYPLRAQGNRWRDLGPGIRDFTDIIVLDTGYLPRNTPADAEYKGPLNAHSDALRCPGDRNPPVGSSRRRYWRSYAYRMGMAGRAYDPFGSGTWTGPYAQNYPKPLIWDTSTPHGGAVSIPFPSSNVGTHLRMSRTLGGRLSDGVGSNAPDHWIQDSPWHRDGVNGLFHDGHAGFVKFGRQLGFGAGTTTQYDPN